MVQVSEGGVAQVSEGGGRGVAMGNENEMWNIECPMECVWKV